jgi:hypothetical protein
MARLFAIFVSLVLFPVLGCDTPATPDPAPAPPALSTSPQVHVLNTQLRGVAPPDDGVTASAAYGHVQVKLTDNGDGTFAVQWKGRIFNPGGESFASGWVGIIDPDIQPPPDGEDGGVILPATRLLTFFRLGGGDAVSCGVIDFDSQGIINPEILPAELAQTWIINPDIHEARFLTLERLEGAVAGTFGPNTPEEPVTTSPGDGQRVRCAV